MFKIRFFFLISLFFIAVSCSGGGGGGGGFALSGGSGSGNNSGGTAASNNSNGIVSGSTGGIIGGSVGGTAGSNNSNGIVNGNAGEVSGDNNQGEIVGDDTGVSAKAKIIDRKYWGIWDNNIVVDSTTPASAYTPIDSSLMLRNDEAGNPIKGAYIVRTSELSPNINGYFIKLGGSALPKESVSARSFASIGGISTLNIAAAINKAVDSASNKKADSVVKADISSIPSSSGGNVYGVFVSSNPNNTSSAETHVSNVTWITGASDEAGAEANAPSEYKNASESYRGIISVNKDTGEFNLIKGFTPGVYTITAEGSDGSQKYMGKTEVTVTNSKNTDTGVITAVPVSESGEYVNFKSNIKFNSDDFIFLEQSYIGKIVIENTGNIAGIGLTYSLEVDSESAPFVESCNMITPLPSDLPAGETKSVAFNISFKQDSFLDVKKNIKINIRITDSNGNEWNDYVNFAVYRESAFFSIDSSLYGLNGHLNIPGIGVISSLFGDIPYIDNGIYYLVLQNSFFYSETLYSIGFNTYAPDYSHFPNLQEINNKTQDTAFELWSEERKDRSVIAFLSKGNDEKGDIHYYKITLNENDLKISFLELSPFFLETEDSYNYITKNGEDILFNGDTAKFSVFMENTGKDRILGVSMNVETSDDYVTVSRISEEPYIIDRIEAGEKVNEKGVSYNIYNEYCDYWTYNSYNNFLISVSEDTPKNHPVQLKITAADKFGHTWTENRQIIVNPTDIGDKLKMSFSELSPFYLNLNGNYSDQYKTDALVNGDTAKFSVFMENTGKERVLGVSMNVETSDDYVTVSRISKEPYIINRIETGEKVSEEGGYYVYHYCNNSNFLITVSEDTPKDHPLQLKITAADKYGHTWTENHQITVNPTGAGANLEYAESAFFLNGEKAEILAHGKKYKSNFSLKNTGNRPVEIRIFSNSLYASDSNIKVYNSGVSMQMEMGKTKDFNAYDSESTSYLSYPYFTLDLTNASAGSANINYSITDSDGKIWTGSIPITIE